ncbi:hypothetical protein LBMAG48_13520 [Phycisphaerae bacterium]|jgi:putative FmdB family regulatory protein|nr:hypothetical protein LBMAG48_13520 [Phycisphaerae bacterium]
MPTYDYRCTACGHTFEQFQSMKDKSLRTCPKCKKPKLERLIGTGGAIIFKGSGFYQTDYRTEGYKKAADADKPTETKSADTKTSEAKPGETKSSDTKSSDTKYTESKSGDNKSAAKSESKPESKPAPKSKPDGKPKKT